MSPVMVGTGLVSEQAFIRSRDLSQGHQYPTAAQKSKTLSRKASQYIPS
jgi:hypothetical protein